MMTEVSEIAEQQVSENKSRPVFEKGNEYSAEPVLENIFNEFWTNLSLVTKKLEGKRVTVAMRAERAKIYKEDFENAYKTGIGSQERQKHREEYIKMRKNEEELVNQMDLKVETVWGDQEAKYTVLNREAGREKPPIVIVPGSSNGVESMDSLLMELAKRYPDRQIWFIGYPDAPSGKVTEDFYKAAVTIPGYQAHCEYFRKAIKKLIPEGDIELGSYSGGCAITERLLYETDIQDRVTNAWLIAPAGTVSMSDISFASGLIYENLMLAKYLFGDLPKYTFVDDKTKDEQKRMKFEIFKKLGEKCRRDEVSKKMGLMKMKRDGRLMVVSGSKDKLTRADEYFNDKNLPKLREKQSNLHAKVLKGFTHAGLMTNPGLVVDAIEEMRREA